MPRPTGYEHRPKRHHDNPRLKCHYDGLYAGLRVHQHRLGPLIEQYLNRSLIILNQAVRIQSRTFVCRFDLRFPAYYSPTNIDPHNALLQTFWRYLKRELKTACLKYRPCLRYLWAREQDSSKVPHYHLMLLLNYDAICTVGDYRPSSSGVYCRDNLSHRVVRSWARAIGWPLEDMKGLVHVCENKLTMKPETYCLRPDDPSTFAEVFYAASYLCKAYSKPIGQVGHPFGSSRL